MNQEQISALAWEKMDGLIPAIVQDAYSGAVLMLGYMNREALQQTLASKRVTFFSRSKSRLWTKGETSGHYLNLVSVQADCDCDALLVLANPQGPVCHLQTKTCFGDKSFFELASLSALDELIKARSTDLPQGSYTTKLFESGIRRIAQKVGEEGVETALAAVAQDEQALLNESADLVYHLLVLLRAKGLGLADLIAQLEQRK